MYYDRPRQAGCIATSFGCFVTLGLGFVVLAFALPSLNALAYQEVIDSGSRVSLEAARLQIFLTNPVMLCGSIFGFFFVWVLLSNVIQRMMGGRRRGINRRAVIHVDEYIEPY